MTIHIEDIQDENGDLIDVVYYCNGICFEAATGVDSYGHAYPCGDETDYDVHCGHCEALLWKGLESDNV